MLRFRISVQAVRGIKGAAATFRHGPKAELCLYVGFRLFASQQNPDAPKEASAPLCEALHRHVVKDRPYPTELTVFI